MDVGRAARIDQSAAEIYEQAGGLAARFDSLDSAEATTALSLLLQSMPLDRATLAAMVAVYAIRDRRMQS